MGLKLLEQAWHLALKYNDIQAARRYGVKLAGYMNSKQPVSRKLRKELEHYITSMSRKN